jgi:hypothetical protein
VASGQHQCPVVRTWCAAEWAQIGLVRTHACSIMLIRTADIQKGFKNRGQVTAGVRCHLCQRKAVAHSWWMCVRAHALLHVAVKFRPSHVKPFPYHFLHCFGGHWRVTLVCSAVACGARDGSYGEQHCLHFLKRQKPARSQKDREGRQVFRSFCQRERAGWTDKSWMRVYKFYFSFSPRTPLL